MAETFTMADILDVYNQIDPFKASDVARILAGTGKGITGTFTIEELEAIGAVPRGAYGLDESGLTGLSSRSLTAWTRAISMLKGGRGAQDQSEAFTEEGLGRSEEFLQLERQALEEAQRIARERIASGKASAAEIRTYAREVATYGRNIADLSASILGETTPLRRALIGATESKLGLPIDERLTQPYYVPGFRSGAAYGGGPGAEERAAAEAEAAKAQAVVTAQDADMWRGIGDPFGIAAKFDQQQAAAAAGGPAPLPTEGGGYWVPGIDPGTVAKGGALFFGPRSSERVALERGYEQARELAIETSPQRGGQLARTLGQTLPENRVLQRTALEQAATDKALGLAIDLGFGTPAQAISGIGQGGNLITSAGGLSTAAGSLLDQAYGGSAQTEIAAGLGFGGIAGQEFANYNAAAQRAQDLSLAQQGFNLAGLQIATQERIANDQASSAKKGSTGAGVGGAVGGIGGGLILAIAL